MNLAELKKAGAFTGQKKQLANITVKKQEQFNSELPANKVLYSVYKGKGEGKVIAVTANYDECELFDIFAKDSHEGLVFKHSGETVKTWLVQSDIIFTDKIKKSEVRYIEAIAGF